MAHAVRTPCILIVIAIVIDPVSDWDDDYDGDEEQAQESFQCGLCLFGIRRPRSILRVLCWHIQEFLTPEQTDEISSCPKCGRLLRSPCDI